MLILKPVLDRPCPATTHPKQRSLGRLTKFHQEPDRDDARATQLTAAVDDDPPPIASLAGLFALGAQYQVGSDASGFSVLTRMKLSRSILRYT